MLHGHAAYVAGAAKVRLPLFLPKPLLLFLSSLISWSFCHRYMPLPRSTPTLFHEKPHAYHADLIVQETLGSYTSTDLQNTGASDKQAGLDEMRAAKAQNDEQGSEVNKNETLGKVEKTLGGAVGCEGMEEEGGKRQA